MAVWKRRRQYLHRTLGVLTSLGVFGLSFSAGLIGHGDLPVTRRFISQVATWGLAKPFRGRIAIDYIEKLSFSEIEVGRAKVFDPENQPTLIARGIHVKLNLLTIAEGALASGPWDIKLDQVDVDDVEVMLDRTKAGKIAIAEAFLPKPKPPSKPTGPSKPPRPLQVVMPHIKLGHVWAHGGLIPKVPLDVELTNVPAKVVAGNHGVRIDVDPTSVYSRGVPPFNPAGVAGFHLRFDPTEPEPLRLWGSLNGRVGMAAFNLDASWIDGRLDAVASAPLVSPGELRGLIPGIGINEPVRLKLTAAGPAEKISVEATAKTEVMSAWLEGNLALRPSVGFDARYILQHVDPHVLQQSLPPGNFAANGKVRLSLSTRGPRVEVSAQLHKTTYFKQKIPETRAKAIWQAGRLSGTAEIDEPGLPTSARFQWQPGGELTIQADSRFKDLRRVERIGNKVGGNGDLHSDIRLSPAGFDGEFRGQATGVVAGPVRVDAGTFKTRIYGPFRNLKVHGTVGAAGLHLGTFKVRGARLSADGPLLSPTLSTSLIDSRWSSLRVSGRLGLKGGVGLTNLRARFGAHNDQVMTEGRVRSIRVGNGGVVLAGLNLKGDVVDLHGDVSVVHEGVHSNVEGSLNLTNLGTVLHANAFPRGHAKFRLVLHSDGRKHRGQFDLMAEDVRPTILPFRVALHSHVNFNGTAVRAKYDAGAFFDAGGKFFQAQGSAGGQMKGSLLRPKTWQEITGSLTAHSIQLDLDKVRDDPFVKLTLDSKGFAHLPRMRGKVYGSVRIDRQAANLPPEIVSSLRTLGLEVDLPPHKKKGKGKQGLKIAGIDLNATMGVETLNGPAGPVKRRFHGAISASDKKGELLFSDAHITTPEQGLEAAVAGLVSKSPARKKAAKAYLKKLRYLAHIALRRRKFADWPAFLRPKGVYGQLEGIVQSQGTIGSPHLTANVRGRGVAVASATGNLWRVDPFVTVALSPKHGRLFARVNRQNKEIASLDASIDGRLGEWFSKGPIKAHWDARALATLRGMKLEALPYASQLGLGGRVSGTISAAGLHTDPRLLADLRVLNGSALGDALRAASLTANIREGESEVALRLEQAASEGSPDGGLARVSMKGSVTFKDKLIPTINMQQTQALTVGFQHFDMSMLSAVTRPIVSEIGGYLDTYDQPLTLSLGAKQADGSSRPKWISGRLEWSKGSLSIPKIGQSFSGGRVVMRAKPIGETTQVIAENFQMEASRGRVTGSARVVIPTKIFLLSIMGKLQSEKGQAAMNRVFGRARFDVAKQSKIPIAFEGVPLGDAYGSTKMDLAIDNSKVVLSVAAERLNFELAPQKKKLLGLLRPPDIGLVQRRKDEDEVSGVPNTSRPLIIKLGLASTLDELLNHSSSSSGQVSVRRPGVNVSLRGRPYLVFKNGELSMYGLIETVRGRVLVLGKPFQVERGNISFRGKELKNPYLDISSVWESSDNVRVYAEVIGPLKQARLLLRSDPPRPNTEVLSLLLVGREAVSVADSRGGAQVNSSGLAATGGVASTVLNNLLDPVNLFGRRVETRVDTSSAQGTRLGVATELHPNLWAQVDVNTADRSTRQNQDVSSVTLDWRFRSNWSLRTSVGDRGSSSVDVIWQNRY